MDILEYQTLSGASPFGRWFDRLDARAAAKVTVALTRIAQGNLSNVKGVGKGVLEFRLDYGPGYRLYFGRDGERLVILLTGGTKKRQQQDRRRAGVLAGLQEPQERRRLKMALTRAFKERVQARVQQDAAFREALLAEGVDALLAGDVETGKAVLRDYINATIGFEELAEATGTPPKSLMRMFSPAGNPNARNLFSVLGELQKHSGVHLRARSERASA